jgi:hypothetical protein
MRIYWSLGSIPELADLSVEERCRFWRDGLRATMSRWGFWSWAAVWLPTVGVGTFVVAGLNVATLSGFIIDGSLALVVYLLSFATAGAIGFIFSGWLLVELVRPRMRQARIVEYSAVSPGISQGTESWGSLWQLYWVRKSVPELQGLSRAEQRRLWRGELKNAFAHWQGWGVFLVCIFFTIAGAFAGCSVAMPGASGLDDSLVRLTCGSLVGGLGLGLPLTWLVARPLIIFVMRPYLRLARRSLARPVSR